MIWTSFGCFLVTSCPVYAFDLTLAWDPNTEPDLAGYKIYIGYSSRQYSWALDVGNRTTGTLKNLEPETVYYITLTAYNSQGIESNFSNEVRFPDWRTRVFLPIVASGPN